MKIEVLVATMNQTDYSLLDKMNIKTDAIIGNQCNRNSIEEFEYKSHKIRYLNFAEKGVGLNRNNSLMRATGDICIIADDDIVFYEGYEETVKKYFKKLRDADIIIFNLNENPAVRYINKKIFRVNKRNFTRYGAARIAFKRKSVSLNNIYFNINFGGGTQYSCGEDTLFLKECLDKKLKIYAVPDSLAQLFNQRDSTWFYGYNDKFFFDKGVLYYFLNKKFCKLFSLYHCIKHRNEYKDYKWKNAYKKMIEGINFYKGKNN